MPDRPVCRPDPEAARTLARLVEDCQDAADEWRAGTVASALAILAHVKPTPDNLMVVADLLREESADHLRLCGRIEPRLNAVLWTVMERLEHWEFENGAWQYYPPAETSLPSVRSALQEVER